ncbi:hypothetical protein HK102_001036 [Quaeritorhiza haematococci]|nr:hypothetical protein HK102_001036 [Quaeritorhiza haematococci]
MVASSTADVRQRLYRPSDDDDSNTSENDNDIAAKVSASWIPFLHTVIGYLGFIVALAVSYSTKYKEVVKNEWYGYPEEWFPSVSAVTGDWYPARNVFQVFIALTAGPRFLLLFFNHVLHRPLASRGSSPSPYTTTGTSVLLYTTTLFGLTRTLAAGVWVYITSTDQHLIHDIGMITYLVAGLFYMIGMTVLSKKKERVARDLQSKKKGGSKTEPLPTTGWRLRLTCIVGFLGLVPFLVYFFIQHKVHRVPGAYSVYAYFEWAIILFDVGFDAASMTELKNVVVQVVDTSFPLSASLGATAKTAGKSSKGREVEESREGIEKQSLTKEDVDDSGVPPTPEGNPSSGGLVSLLFRSEIAAHAADTYLAFVFWTLVTSLPLTIWYFPLWNMGLSGYEAFLFSTLSPSLLAIGPLRRLLAKPHGGFFAALMHLISLVGLLSFNFPDPLTRLVCVAVGTMFSFLVWIAQIIGIREDETKNGVYGSYTVEELEWLSRRKITSFLMGLLLMDVVKVYAYSNNPLWSIMREQNGGLNEYGIVVGVVACLQVMFRGRSVSPLKSRPKQQQQSASKDSSSSSSSSAAKSMTTPWIPVAFGFAALMFLLHSMFTDSAVIVRWSTEGYPHPGPDPLIGGAYVLLTFGIGLMLPFVAAGPISGLVHSTTWFAVGSAGLAALYYLTGGMNGKVPWGFLGGLVFTIYLGSVATAMLGSLRPCRHVGTALLVGTLFYDIFQVGFFTPFVPSVDEL